MVVTRFCPTPTGHLHHGNLYVALLNQEFARRHQGRFEVQIDDFFDLFPPRETIDAILEDLEWLGVCPRERVLMHSRNKPLYLRMLDELEAKGKVKIRRKQKGCCVAKVEIHQNGRPIQIRAARASSCERGEVGYLPFASDPRHVIEPNWISMVHEVANWRHDTFWCSDPTDREPWIEFDLPHGSRPESVRLTCWLPRPEETEVLVKRAGEHWKHAAAVTRIPERVGEIRWAAFIPPQDGTPELYIASHVIAHSLRSVSFGDDHSSN